MSDLRDLYQEVVIDHGRRPRNFHELDPHSHQADGFNPLCGDKMRLFLLVGSDNVIKDVSFTGSGCAISMASASLLSEELKGKTTDEAQALFDAFHRMLTQDDVLPDTDALGKLAVLAGVREYPTRVKCATLSGHTLRAALRGDEQPATTE
ncbi:MAG: SUF system NifU family Fe-S cluster assembly protein [Salinisphaeraceae bacterium]|nr:SUF system NifU family Fe-S cluster assembly protein [Salinisphaeraceae bacterium]